MNAFGLYFFRGPPLLFFFRTRGPLFRHISLFNRGNAMCFPSWEGKIGVLRKKRQ